MATLALDQATKAIAEARLPLGETIDILPILSLHRVHNPGIAFSFLAEFGSLGLVLLTLAITVLVLTLWVRAGEGGKLAALGYGLIIGAALGNLADRLIYGHVIDFLLLHFGDRTLFVFNVADAALTLGPIALLAVYLWPSRNAVPPRN